MIAESLKTRVIVGMEVHVQLATRTKLFCGCALEFGAEPNSRTCPVCLGLPGALPVMNRRAFEDAVRLALAMNCRIAPFTKWDRKSYYYPDLPKNYQISQYDLPLGSEGHFDVPAPDGSTRQIRIRRAHLEEDAGKNLHDVPGCSLVDLNRTGTPLVEIVTEPDIASAEEAYVFCTELQHLVTYLGVSGGSMQKGHMRFEPNINVEIEHDGVTYRTPIAEVKNLNSFRAVRDAVAYETQRHVRDWLANREYVFGKAPNENRGWNADRGITEFQRGKEAAHDYRYFPDPDLVPVVVESEWADRVRDELPELPLVRGRRFIEQYSISEKDCYVFLADPESGILFEYGIARGADPTTLAKHFVGIWNPLAVARGTTVGRLGVPAESMYELAALVDEGALSATAASKLAEMILARSGEQPPDDVSGLARMLADKSVSKGMSQDSEIRALAEREGLIQVQDVGQTNAWVEQAFAENEQAVRDALSNPKKAKAAPGFLTGQVMRISGGKADPQVTGKLIGEKLARLREQA